LDLPCILLRGEAEVEGVVALEEGVLPGAASEAVAAEAGSSGNLSFNDFGRKESEKKKFGLLKKKQQEVNERDSHEFKLSTMKNKD
jgi:hypothetical protein